MVVFSHDSKLVASASLDKTARIWSVETGNCEQVLEGHGHWVGSEAFPESSGLCTSGKWDVGRNSHVICVKVVWGCLIFASRYGQTAILSQPSRSATLPPSLILRGTHPPPDAPSSRTVLFQTLFLRLPPLALPLSTAGAPVHSHGIPSPPRHSTSPRVTSSPSLRLPWTGSRAPSPTSPRLKPSMVKSINQSGR
ncbi:hypothetical protein B0J13DRAFT_579426 [Dactylonectria estremocensis]|uniref:Uncharacterized protein n=1 Tax=Dactylonectria estremocensis TaxID=1079267 RepID=A0A9P9CXR6_9HYPO|nr:hypothetical protein B0J13DRAFT_579426 [Dactylonectria estremocensis]